MAPSKTSQRLKARIKARDLKKRVSRLENKVASGEVHYKDTYQFGIQVTSSGSVPYLLTNVNDGDTISERQGLQVNHKNLELRYSSIIDDNTNIFRCIVFKWFDSTAPSVGDVLFSTLTGSTGTISPLTNTTRKRYQILHDKVHAMSASGGNQTLVRSHNINLRGKCVWNGTTGASIEYGNIYIMFVSDSTVLGPSTSWFTRYRFTED